MLFNSLEYILFLPIVFLLYWFVFDHTIKNNKQQLLWQNMFIVVVSYIFYGWWDWRFLILIAITTFLSFLSGIGIERFETKQKKKIVMIINIIINLGILGVYKYYDFFVKSFADAFNINSEPLLLNLILPVGISFYTFQALSYSIDVYRNHIKPTHNIVEFTAFISFFPQLVAGPIERATNLLPQFQQKRHFDYNQATHGMRLILWGLFKKIVVADNCGIYVDTIWNDISSQNASSLAFAAILFSFQIYGDFSGYSDIAIGSAKLFGIQLRENFRTPFFSRNIAELWRRWHISLTKWFVDYVYIPLGGSKKGKIKTIRNTIIIFLLCGFWHGANWTYILWGLYCASTFIPSIITNTNRKYTDDQYNYHNIPKMLTTFLLFTIGFIIFRSPSISDCYEFIKSLFDISIFSIPNTENAIQTIITLIAISIMLIMEWNKKLPNKWWMYYGLCFAIWWFAGQDIEFIYFQF